MNINQDFLKQIVEAAVMAAEAPISERQILALFPEDACPPREQVMDIIERLAQECEDRGVVLRRIGNGWRYQTREDLAPWLRKMNEGRPPRYSRALLETLAIIAYRQPVTRGDIEDIRGVAVSSEIMRTLQEREWVRQVGVRDVPGHPGLYGTTSAFLAYFNLESLKELPELIEQRDLETIAREQNLGLLVDGLVDESETAPHAYPDDSFSDAAASSRLPDISGESANDDVAGGQLEDSAVATTARTSGKIDDDSEDLT